MHPTVLNFTKFEQNICFINTWIGENCKSPAGFELRSYRFVVIALTNCATLLVKNFGDKSFIELYLI